MFGVFRSAIRIIDHAKRATLNQQLLKSIRFATLNEKQEETLTALSSGSDPVHIDCKE